MDMHAHALVIHPDTVGTPMDLARGLFKSGEASVILEHHRSLGRAGTRVICGIVTSMPRANDRKCREKIRRRITISEIIAAGCSQLVDSKRRDAGAVDQARLESEAGYGHRATPSRFKAHAISDLALGNDQ